MKGAYTKRITRKILMAMASVTMLVMGNHELGRKTQQENGQVEMLSLRQSTYVEEMSEKSTFFNKEKPVGKTLGLGSRIKGVEAKEAESENKLVECFLSHGPHRLRKCLRKSIIEGDDRADKEPKKLGSSKGKVEAKKSKRSKKKRVKCFLYRGLY
ncbi:hypothetical protein Goshw_004835, partial [Gossypium schwendimanii]|nr:hypothetical protein [Gossypium schwendimanii]